MVDRTVLSAAQRMVDQWGTEREAPVLVRIEPARRNEVRVSVFRPYSLGYEPGHGDNPGPLLGWFYLGAGAAQSPRGLSKRIIARLPSFVGLVHGRYRV